MGYKKRMSFCQQNVPQVDTWQYALRTKSARTVQIAGVRKRKGYNVFCVRRVRIAPCLLRRGWGGNTRISGKVVWGQRDGGMKVCLMFCLSIVPVYEKWS